MSFFTGFAVSATIYWSLNRIFPVIGAAKTFLEVDLSEMVKIGEETRGSEEDVDAEESKVSKEDDVLTSVHAA